MTVTPTPDAPLSRHWAFVVQLREGTALTPEGLHGRVEHIVSGQATHFSSVEDCWRLWRGCCARGAAWTRAPHGRPTGGQWPLNPTEWEKGYFEGELLCTNVYFITFES